MTIKGAGEIKIIEGYAVRVEHGLESHISADPKAGKVISKKTAVYINNEDMIALDGWLRHEKAFLLAREAFKGTSWEF